MMSTDMDNLPDVEPTAMSFRLVRDITDGFSKEQLIGRGEFGDVYKGVCGDGRAIAVRKLYPLQEIDDEQLQKEFANLTKVHHQNIVRLLGYCYEQEQLLVPYNGTHVFALKTDRAMCFEYLQNGSLDRYISDTSSGLDWHTRYRIIKGICEGLRYLHEELKSPILHMNLKPSKILLDQHMKPKIGGFGLQRLLGEGNVRRMGTIAYMPPEFIERQVISHKFDIYSIGVIIIELMTGGRSGCNDVYSNKFIELAHEEWRERLQKTVNGTSVEGYYQQVKKCLEIALKCMEYDRHERPSIGDIVHSLNEIETLIPEEVRVVQNRFDSRNSELLDVHPLELCFPFMLKGRKNDMISCSLQLKNRGGDGVVFMLVANSPKRYLTKKPLCGIVPPRCAYTLTLTMLRQPPSTLSDSSVDFFTLYSVTVGQYDLLNVDKDFIQYGNFFKRSTEYADEVQVATLKVICDRPAAKSAGTSPEIIATTPDAQQVSSIDVHPTEPWIVTTSRVGSLCLWNYLTMATFKSLQLMAHEPVHTAKFIAREKWLVASDHSGGIHVYSYDQNQHVKSFDAHNNSCITTLAVHPTDPFVLSSSDDDDDHLIKLWDWNKDWKCTRIFQGHTDRVTQVTFNPEDKDSFASASWDGTVKIWSLCSNDPNNIITLKLEDHVPENLLCVDYFTLLDRRHLIVGCKDRTAQIWKLGMEGCVDRLEGHTDRISAVNLHPEVPILMTGSLDGTVRVWDSTTYKLENIIAFNLGAVYAFGCIKGSRRIVVGCHRGIAMVEISFP